MTDDSSPDPRSHSAPIEIDFDIAHPARVYDYLLGGKDNYPADREAAERAFADYPGGVHGVGVHVRAQRAFLSRAVHYVAADAGVHQFLDTGTGIPSANNTHQVAQRAEPRSRIVYVDNDPIVLAHARALLTSTPEGATDYIHADLRDPEQILEGAAATLDFSEPVAVMLLGILQMIGGDHDPHDIVRRLVEATPPGSYLVISHLASDVVPEMVDSADELSHRMREDVYPRTNAEVARFFDGLELVDPGVVQLAQWQPGLSDAAPGGAVPAHGGVARKP